MAEYHKNKHNFRFGFCSERPGDLLRGVCVQASDPRCINFDWEDGYRVMAAYVLKNQAAEIVDEQA